MATPEGRDMVNSRIESAKADAKKRETAGEPSKASRIAKAFAERKEATPSKVQNSALEGPSVGCGGGGGGFLCFSPPSPKLTSALLGYCAPCVRQAKVKASKAAEAKASRAWNVKEVKKEDAKKA